MTQEVRSPWISAWFDPVAGVTCLSQLMTLADLKDDGDNKLIVADYKHNNVKIYMGTNVILNAQLKGKPSAITTYYDSSKKP